MHNVRTGYDAAKKAETENKELTTGIVCALHVAVMALADEVAELEAERLGVEPDAFGVDAREAACQLPDPVHDVRALELARQPVRAHPNQLLHVRKPVHLPDRQPRQRQRRPRLIFPTHERQRPISDKLSHTTTSSHATHAQTVQHQTRRWQRPHKQHVSKSSEARPRQLAPRRWRRGQSGQWPQACGTWRLRGPDTRPGAPSRCPR
eukprot:227181-Rhodomonas_salina.3